MLNPDQFNQFVPAYVEYPASSERSDDEDVLIPRHELETAQYLDSRHGTHTFRLHDGRHVHVDQEHYTPTQRNHIEKYEEDPGWVSVKDEHDSIIDSIWDRFNK